ncbi:MAG: ABC transporter ATP-binding protein [Alphaproteobacteria bacterium]
MTPTVPSAPLLELRHIGKTYPGVRANDAIDLSIAAGEIHALLGENGAGKSTLVKIIYGVVRPDEGEILWQGRPVAIDNPAAARRLGIGMVFQHFTLFETLTVAENILLALDDAAERKALPARIAELSKKYGLDLDPHRHVHALSVGERQRVEIVRCLLQNPKLLIMDEPTSVLTPVEADALFATLRRLAAEGKSVLFISHKLEEIKALCRTATILRGGKVVARCLVAEQDSASLARLMIGGEPKQSRHAAARKPGGECLVVEALNLRPADPFGTPLRNVDLQVRAGEIVGIAGVAGNGQAELLAALSGETMIADAEAIRLNGAPIGRLRPSARRKRGLAFVPEERLGRGAVAELDLADNAILTGYTAGLAMGGTLRPDRAQKFAEQVIATFGVVCAGQQAAAQSLSGGNMQKFIIGREIKLAPKLLIAAHPTWGVDVGAAAVIHQALIDLSDAGCAVLIVSEDLDELLALSDRLAVISRGTLSPARPTAAWTRDEIGAWMAGLHSGGKTSHAA